MNKLNSTFLSICAAASLLLPYQSHAANKDDETSSSEISNVDYKALESVGLLDADSKGSLGAGIYHQTSRAALTSLVKNLESSDWVALERTVNHFLLTSADASAITNDIEVQSGQDLFTLRVNALLKRGLNKEAFELFTKIQEEVHQESLARSGVISMLLNKESALACLETKTLLPHFKAKLFWQELDAYCTLSLSKKQHQEQQDTISDSKKIIIQSILGSHDYMYEYDIATFSDLSPLERALLTTDDRITLTDFSPELYEEIPSQHISALLQQSNISDENRILLTAQSVRHSISDISSLISLYEELYKKYKEQKIKPEGIEEIVTLYDQTKGTWSSKNRNKNIKHAFRIADDYGDLVLLPFLPTFENMNIGDDLSLENTKRILSLLLHTDYLAPAKWANDLEDLSFDDPETTNLKSQIFFAMALLSKSVDTDILLHSQKSIQKQPLSDLYKVSYTFIIENIDSSKENSDKVGYIYENDFDLNRNKSYTMPRFIIIDELKQSSRNKDIGTSLLLTNAILSGITSKDLYIGTLRDVAIALSNTGLKQLSRRILAQAILETEH